MPGPSIAGEAGGPAAGRGAAPPGVDSLTFLVVPFFDLVLFPTLVDLRPYRLLAALTGLLFLLYGFIWEAE